jgi:hypothetical protein
MIMGFGWYLFLTDPTSNSDGMLDGGGNTINQYLNQTPPSSHQIVKQHNYLITR